MICSRHFNWWLVVSLVQGLIPYSSCRCEVHTIRVQSNVFKFKPFVDLYAYFSFSFLNFPLVQLWISELNCIELQLQYFFNRNGKFQLCLWYLYWKVTRINENKSFRRKKIPICDWSPSGQMPLTDRITVTDPYVRTYFWITI